MILLSKKKLEIDYINEKKGDIRHSVHVLKIKIFCRKIRKQYEK